VRDIESRIPCPHRKLSQKGKSTPPLQLRKGTVAFAPLKFAAGLKGAWFANHFSDRSGKILDRRNLEFHTKELSLKEPATSAGKISRGWE
jgi:hypothetical protein